MSRAGEGTRTPNRLFTKQVLYRLSYASTPRAAKRGENCGIARSIHGAGSAVDRERARGVAGEDRVRSQRKLPRLLAKAAPRRLEATPKGDTPPTAFRAASRCTAGGGRAPGEPRSRSASDSRCQAQSVPDAGHAEPTRNSPYNQPVTTQPLNAWLAGRGARGPPRGQLGCKADARGQRPRPSWHARWTRGPPSHARPTRSAPRCGSPSGRCGSSW